MAAYEGSIITKEFQQIQQRTTLPNALQWRTQTEGRQKIWHEQTGRFLCGNIATAIILGAIFYIHVSGTQDRRCLGNQHRRCYRREGRRRRFLKIRPGRWTASKDQSSETGDGHRFFKRTSKTELKDLGGQQYVIKSTGTAKRTSGNNQLHGSEYASVANQFSGKFLTILNYNWQDRLKASSHNALKMQKSSVFRRRIL